MREQLNRMNRIKGFYICLCSAMTIFLYVMLLMAQQGGITAKDPKAKEAVDAALKALGGSDKIDGIKSIIITGTGTDALYSPRMPLDIVTVQGKPAIDRDSVPIEVRNTVKFNFEIRMLLPDSFIEIDRFPDRTTYTGISKV